MKTLTRSAIDFLGIDLDLGLTLARIASQARLGSDKRKRNTLKARSAYDAVLRHRQKLELAPEDSQAVNEGLSQLRGALEQLGDQF